MVEGAEKKWYAQTWVVVLFLIFLWPVGLFLMWRFTDWKKTAKTIVTIVISAYFVICVVVGILMFTFVFNAISEQSKYTETNPIGDEAEFNSGIIGDDQEDQTEWDLTEDTDDMEEVGTDDPIDSVEEVSSLEDLTLHFDDRDWELGYEDEEAGIMIREYVVDGESVEAWTELVTAQFFSNLQGIDPQEFVDIMEENMKSDVTGDVEWNVLNKKDDEVMYEFILTNDDLYPDHHEMARAIVVDDGLFVLHYAIMEAPMSDDHHKQWEDLLEKATIKN